jgi:hypothetical protein
MNERKKNRKMETVEGRIVEIRPDEKRKRKVGVYLEDADGNRTWYDYWKPSKGDALPPGLVEDRRVRLEVRVTPGDKEGWMFRDIKTVEPLDESMPVDQDDDGGRHADRPGPGDDAGQRCTAAVQLPPPIEQLVDRLVGIYGEDRGEVLVWIIRHWYMQNSAEVEQMITVIGKVSDE